MSIIANSDGADQRIRKVASRLTTADIELLTLAALALLQARGRSSTTQDRLLSELLSKHDGQIPPNMHRPAVKWAFGQTIVEGQPGSPQLMVRFLREYEGSGVL